ncbi:MAG: S6e family ribosomal protein [Candidatus Njordarchaeales archaeon]
MSKKELSIKLVVCDSKNFLGTGITTQFEINEADKKAIFYNKKIGERIDGAQIGFPTYVFQIRGASDIAGFPHLKGIPGSRLKKILKKAPPGYRPRKYKIEKKVGGYKIVNLKGVYRKKTVRGEELSEQTRQVNVSIIEKKGKSVTEMDEKDIMNDKILKEISYKVGNIITKWGLEILSVKNNEELLPFQEKIKELGVDDSMLEELKRKIGAAIIKLDHESRRKVLKDAKKLSRNNPSNLGKIIAHTTYSAYNALKNGEIKPEDFVGQLPQRILDAIRKWLNEEIKTPPKISLKISLS